MQHGEIFLDEAINWDCSLNRGLVSRWKVLPDHRRGVRFRDLCKRNHGTLTSGPTWSGNAPRGGFGSLSFDGTDDRISTAYSSTSTGVFSVFANLYWQNENNFKTIVGADQSGVGTLGAFYLQRRQGAGFAFDLVNFGDGEYIASDSSVTPGQTSGEYFLGGIYNGTTAYFCRDGQIHGSALAPDVRKSWTDFGIGNGWYGHTQVDFWPGRVSDVFLYSRALSASEVAALYEDSLAGSPRTLNWMKRKAYSFTTAAASGEIAHLATTGGWVF